MKRINNTLLVENETEAALYIIDRSEYTVEEIIRDYRRNRCSDWKKGFWASRGIGWRNGFFIAQVLKLDNSRR